MSPARILYVITDLETGGVPLHLHRLVRSLDRSRFEPLVVSLSKPGPVTELLADDGVPTDTCRAAHALDLGALWRLRRIMLRFRPDLVHALLFHANMATRLVGPLAGVPGRRIINEIQTVEIERTWHLVLDQLTHSLCRCEIGNSPAVVNHLVQRGGLPPEHLVCITGGIDPRRFQGLAPAQRSEWNIPAEAKLLLWVGRMDPVKRLGDLLEAFAQLTLEPPPHLLLVGDGPERDRVETQVSQRGLDKRVHLIGFRTDVPALLAAADVFALPSLTEGLPNALLEAMATGLPVVACAVPGCTDLIDNLINGLLVPPACPQALAGALARLLDDPALASRLGQAARRKVLREYTQAACHQGYLALYERILSSPDLTLPNRRLRTWGTFPPGSTGRTDKGAAS